MATGMQSGSGYTPRTSPGSPGPKSGRDGLSFARLLQGWNNLPPKQKAMYFVILACIVGMLAMFRMYMQSQRDVPLYSRSISTADLDEIDQLLTSWNIPHSITPEKMILLRPSDRPLAMARLADEGLPHLPIQSYGTGDDNLLATGQERDRAYLEQKRVELIETLRMINGIADAQVQIVAADPSAGTQARPPTASVMLMVQPNTTMSEKQIYGIINLVAYSVAGLEPKNVAVMNQNGELLSTDQVLGGSNPDPLMAGVTPIKLERKLAIEKELADKVKTILDRVLGPGRSAVAINVTLNWDQRETASETYGGPANPAGEVVISEQTDTETFLNKPGGGGGDGALPNPGASGNADYVREQAKLNRRVSRSVSQTVSDPGEIRRLTASVVVDNLKEDQRLKLESVIRDAIGYDAARGDNVTVESMPISSWVNPAGNPMNPLAAPPPTRPTTPGSPYAMAIVPIALILIIAAFYLFRQHRQQASSGQMFLAGSPTTSVTTISDLITEKSGTPVAPPGTRVGSMDQLNRLAREKPDQVADLLRNTWLDPK